MENSKGKKIKKIFTYFLGIYFILSGVLISCENVSAATTTLPKEEYTPVKQVISADPLKFTPQIKIPSTTIDGTVEVGKQVGTKMVSTLLPSYIGAFYKYGLTVTGLLATVILMAGGIIWLTSAGNESKVKQAKEMIFGSLAGVLLLFSSYIILETINPDLVKLKPIESQSIDKVTLDYVCCQTTTSAEMMEAKECTKKGGARMSNYFPENNKCIKQGCCLSENKTGVVSCSPSTKDSCGMGEIEFITKVTWTEKACSEDTRCKGLIKNPCDGKEDLTPCGLGGRMGSCYYQHCYIGTGKISEPCGNDGGVCTNSKCSSWDTSFWASRNCATGLWCCAPVTPVECEGKNDGDKCITDRIEGTCYNNICYTGKGKNGEPCGFPKNHSVCVHKDNGTCDKWDTSNYRSCTDKTWCCIGGVIKK